MLSGGYKAFLNIDQDDVPDKLAFLISYNNN